MKRWLFCHFLYQTWWNFAQRTFDTKPMEKPCPACSSWQFKLFQLLIYVPITFFGIPYSRFPRTYWTDLHDLLVPEFSKSPTFANLRFPKRWCLTSGPRFFIELFGASWCLHSWNNWFWGPWTHPEIQKSWKGWYYGFPHHEIESLLIQNEAY